LRGLGFIAGELRALEGADRRRRLRRVAGRPGRLIEVDGRRVVNLSSNDYLGLAGHEALVGASREALDAGTGSTASRLIVGNRQAHEQLEAELAAFHGTEAARLFNSGYQANLGVLSALVGRGDRLVSDALNHASLIDGCRLSQAEVVVVAHGDVGAFERALSQGGARRQLVVTDGLFSMDGDRASVTALASLCDRFDAGLLVDEAHAVGVLGDGRGLCAEQGAVADVLVGTLGKAFGSFGAYVAGSEDLCELLLNRARSFVFSTALPEGVVAASRTAVGLVGGPEGGRRREALEGHCRRVQEIIEELGLPGSDGTPIVPILARGNAEAMRATDLLMERGLFVQGIRPPTVPEGGARLRVALRADLEEADLEGLRDGLRVVRDAGLLRA